MDRQLTFVLVHGAWHGGWCWRRVADILQAQGHRVFTPTLTGVGERAHLMSDKITLATHVADIVNVFRFEGIAEACLVGHSYGGFPISLAAEELGPRVSSIAFLDAFVPEDGDHPLDLISTKVREDVRAAIAKGEVSRAPPPAAYFKVQRPEDIAWVDSLMTPQPNCIWGDRVRLSGAREQVPKKSYIRAGLYPNVNFDENLARQKQKPGWQTFVVAAGHDVMVDAPDELARLLVEIA